MQDMGFPASLHLLTKYRCNRCCKASHQGKNIYTGQLNQTRLKLCPKPKRKTFSGNPQSCQILAFIPSKSILILDLLIHISLEAQTGLTEEF